MATKRSFLSEISWFQVVAGALAAMTAAWIASALGVAGTLIGAALGSLVFTTTSAFYASTLDKGRTLIVQTDGGTRVETRAEPGDTAVALAEVAEATGSPVQGAEVVDDGGRRIRWRVVAATTAAVLVLSGAAMGSYELLTDRAYGSDPDNARIGNPFGGSSTTPDEEAPAEDVTPEPTSPTPAPGTTRPPTPTPSPTAPAPSAPTPDPTPTPGTDAE